MELFHPTYNWWAHFTHPLLDPMADFLQISSFLPPPKKRLNLEIHKDYNKCPGFDLVEKNANLRNTTQLPTQQKLRFFHHCPRNFPQPNH